MNVLFVTGDYFVSQDSQTFYRSNKVILMVRISMLHNYATAFTYMLDESNLKMFDVVVKLRKQGIGLIQKHGESIFEMEDEGLFKLRLSINQDSYFLQTVD